MIERPTPLPAGPGQESVWAYPRPPRLEPEPELLRILHGGELVAETRAGWRVLETSHPPTYYLPRSDVRASLVPAGGGSLCEWKGRASYLDVIAGGRTLPRVAWCYPEPTPAFAAIAGHLAFYAAPFDECWVGAARATPQPGGFYGGWVTDRVVGPFKGVPGSQGW